MNHTPSICFHFPCDDSYSLTCTQPNAKSTEAWFERRKHTAREKNSRYWFNTNFTLSFEGWKKNTQENEVLFIYLRVTAAVCVRARACGKNGSQGRAELSKHECGNVDCVLYISAGQGL